MSTHIINFPGADIHTTTITSVSNVSVGENLDVTSNLTVSGNTALSSNLFVTGNVGIGTTEPTESLDIVGNLNLQKVSNTASIKLNSNIVMELPKHDRPLVKYPEVAMTANSSGGYTASASSYYNVNNYPPYEAFNGVYGTELDMWIPRNYSYLSDGNVDTANVATFQGVYGEYLSLSMPNKIKLEKIRVHSRNNTGASQSPENGRIYGSNDNSTWTQIGTYTGLNMLHNDYRTIIVNASEYYKDYTFQIEKMKPFGPATYTCIAELEYYGTEEGDTSVDVVHRSIPNKPGQQHLEVYWDANDSDSYSFADSSNVYDLSGNGVTGTITGNNGFDTEYNAWVFDGSGDYIRSGNIGLSGAQVMSVSFWFRYNSVPTGRQDPFTIGKSGTAVQFGLATYTPGTYLYTGGNDIYNTGYNIVTDTEWHHVVAIYSGGTPSTTTMSLYVDNVNVVDKLTGSSATQALNLDSADCTVNVGSTPNQNAVLNGKVSSFRLFGKTLNADQVRELYEYDAPRFGHRQNLVSLHKGNLGVGVAHPTSRFEVAGTETLQEYPPKAMTGFETYMEGHGVFRVSASSSYSGYHPWQAFDKIVNVVDSNWHSATGIYDSSDGSFTGLYSLGGYHGEYIILEMPYRVTLTSIGLHPRVPANLARMISDGQLIGSNDGSSWESIYSFYGLTWPTSTWQYLNFTNSKKYKYIALVVTKIGNDTYLNIGEIKFFGTPAPSSLEDGHLTLGKALTLPRVSGHPAGAETPRAESLVVHYDTTVDSVVTGTTVVDTSGNGINSAMENGLVYSSNERALVFDGTNDRTYISSVKNGSGAWVHSMSLWCKSNSAANSSDDTFAFIGEKSSYKCIGLEIQGNENFRYYFWSSDADTPTGSFTRGVWHHVVVTYDGGSSTTSKSVYIDGVKQTLTQSAGTTALNLNANDEFLLGSQQGGSKPLNGSISNFKMWNVALTADDVAAEYALGRTGKALNITDTSVCLGGTVPRAQLDVRGSARFDGNVGIGTASPVATLDVNGSVRISGTMSLPGLPYAFVTYGTNTGWTAFNNSILPHSSVKVQSSHNAFDTSTYKFTCPNDGVYKISVSNLVGQNGYVHIYFQKNGARIDPNIHLNQNGKGPWWINMTGDHIVACSAGDELYINGHTGGTYTDIYVNSAYAYAYYQQIA